MATFTSDMQRWAIWIDSNHAFTFPLDLKTTDEKKKMRSAMVNEEVLLLEMLVDLVSLSHFCFNIRSLLLL